MKREKNRYILLRIKILLTILVKGKISIKKIMSIAVSWLAHKRRRSRTSKYPFMINFELWNECNAQCTFCRTLDGDIYDQNPSNSGTVPVPKGKMSLELYKDVIDQAKDHLLIAVLYVNGEPLMYNGLYDAIRYASDRNVATVISSNGELMTESNSRKLLESDLDFLKVAISGFSDETVLVQHRTCHIEKIKENLKRFAQLIWEGNYRTLVMVDYVDYQYNSHEKEAARQFCADNGFVFNARPGNLFHLEDDHPDLLAKEKPPHSVDLPLNDLCEWPWKVMTINWNGDVFPCCDYVVWNDVEPLARLEAGKTDLAAVFNGESAAKNRFVHATQGRKAIDICALCPRTDTAFKY
jgi:MoaA/NifB/PqqE/SkfB family radical SAM enzyme